MVAAFVINGAETERLSCWKFENIFPRKKTGKNVPKCAYVKMVKNQQSSRTHFFPNCGNSIIRNFKSCIFQTFRNAAIVYSPRLRK